MDERCIIRVSSFSASGKKVARHFVQVWNEISHFHADKSCVLCAVMKWTLWNLFLQIVAEAIEHCEW